MGGLDAARELARFGWPVLPVQAGGKLPLTAHGVKDATTDDVRIGQWWRKWPDANVAVATGAPGPTVLDVDDLEAAGPMLPELERTGAPQVATPRGRHFYFAGQPAGTVGLGYGELRGQGSYVVCPPSVHPSGREYVWLVEPNGPLPPAPAQVARDRKGKGAGTREPVERVPHGKRHDHLADLAVRLVRSGVLEVDAIERALVAEYDAVCDKKPAALPMYFTKIAKWAAGSDIAGRERKRRQRLDADGGVEPDEPKRKTKRQVPYAPARDAPLAELRAFVRIAAGLPDVIRIDEVIRHGSRVVDAMHIRLSNGMVVRFDRQGDLTLPRVWQSVWTTDTAGIAKTGYLKAAELGDVLWALCVIARTLAGKSPEDVLQELVDDLVAMAELVHGTLVGVEPRYLLLGALLDRPKYDASDRSNAARPTLVVDMRTGKRYLRAGELVSLANYRRLGISSAQFAGRMTMVGLERHTVQALGDAGRRRQVLYELPDEGAE
jgi:Bifunctional DNA primase/polymerase, N-terminal